jgi:phosphoglycolate phosphatase-like HAD superfamily hydrolase
VKALAFDLDGTLVDSSTSDYMSYKDAMSWLGYPSLAPAHYRALRRRSLRSSAIAAMTIGQGDQPALEAYREQRQQWAEDEGYLSHDSLLPGAVDALKACCQRYRCYVVTARFKLDTALRQLAWLGLSPCLTEAFLTGYDDKAVAFARLSELYAVVGDTEFDVLPAKRLGVMSVAVASGTRDRDFLRTLAPDHLLDGVGQLLDIL